MENNFKKDKRKVELLQSAKEWFYVLAATSNLFNKDHLPTLAVELTEKVLSYLSNSDLKNLILCGENLKDGLKSKDIPSTSVSDIEATSIVKEKEDYPSLGRFS